MCIVVMIFLRCYKSFFVSKSYLLLFLLLIFLIEFYFLLTRQGGTRAESEGLPSYAADGKAVALAVAVPGNEVRSVEVQGPCARGIIGIRRPEAAVVATIVQVGAGVAVVACTGKR